MANLLFSFVDRRRQANKSYLQIVGLIFFLNLFFILLTDFNLQQEKNRMIQAQAFFKEKINELSRQDLENKLMHKKVSALMKELFLIKELVLSSFLSKILLNQFLSSFPEKIYLKQMSRKGNLVKLEGVLKPPANLAVFLNTIEKNEWFENPRLIELKKGNHFMGFFKFSFALKTKSILVNGIQSAV
ncbi:MAG: PilN domain-containing protein [Proteobacteria bacterium]|nr:PilN domain-containing protein [Pseudomonadota bacterium]